MLMTKQEKAQQDRVKKLQQNQEEDK